MHRPRDIPAGTVATVEHVPDEDTQRLAVVPGDIALQAALTLRHGEVWLELREQLPDARRLGACRRDAGERGKHQECDRA